MARFTKVGGTHVCQKILGRRKRTVMTTNTRSICGRMIKDTHKPDSGCMTNIACFRRRNVRCRIFTDGNHTVMTAFPKPEDFGMIPHGGRRPYDRSVGKPHTHHWYLYAPYPYRQRTHCYDR